MKSYPPFDKIRPVDWLVSLRKEYRDTPLSSWKGREDSEFLSRFATLRGTFPQHLIIATDYLFAQAGPRFEERLSEIRLADVEDRKLDRTSSMQGGFPWTSADHPWPTQQNQDGSVEFARPAIQLNLSEIGIAVGIALPEALFQLWGGGAWELEEMIPLEDINGAQPDWSYPSREQLIGGLQTGPFGWCYEECQDSELWDWVGNKIEVGDSVFDLPEMAWCLTGEDYDLSLKEEPWVDVYQWLKSNYSTTGELPDFVSRIEPRLEKEATRALAREGSALEKIRRSEQKAAARKGVLTGAFLGSARRMQGSTKMHNLALSGISNLYEPGWLRESSVGLSFENGDGSLMITYQSPTNLLSADPVYDETRVSYHKGHYSA